MTLDPSAFVADPSLLEGLEKRSLHISCGEDRVLFRQGDAPTGVYILKSGGVTLSMGSASGSDVFSITAISGSILGLPGMIGNQPYTLAATAHAGAQLEFLDRESFTELMSGNPLLAFKVLQILAAEVRSARGAMVEQLAAPLRRRRQ